MSSVCLPLVQIFVQLYKDEKNDGQLMLGMFLHRRRADAKSERFVDERERVALRFQFTCPCQRGLIVLGTVACDSKETYMPPVRTSRGGKNKAMDRVVARS